MSPAPTLKTQSHAVEEQEGEACQMIETGNESKNFEPVVKQELL
jgi:hypothetical protein